MIEPPRKHSPLDRRLATAAVALSAALVLAVVVPLALAATGPTAGGTTHASHASHRGKCARHARRRHGRRHHPCSARRRTAPKAPAPTLALVPPAGPTAQPVTLVAPLPAPVAPSASAPASEGGTPGPGGGQVGEPGEPPSVPHVQVSAVEYAFTLSRTTVPAGKVIFQFVNNGQDEHNLQIASSEGPPAGSFANTPSKGIGDLALEMQPGTYTLICSLPTHEQKGMKATLTVE